MGAAGACCRAPRCRSGDGDDSKRPPESAPLYASPSLLPPLLLPPVASSAASCADRCGSARGQSRSELLPRWAPRLLRRACRPRSCAERPRGCSPTCCISNTKPQYLYAAIAGLAVLQRYQGMDADARGYRARTYKH